MVAIKSLVWMSRTGEIPHISANFKAKRKFISTRVVEKVFFILNIRE